MTQLLWPVLSVKKNNKKKTTKVCFFKNSARTAENSSAALQLTLILLRGFQQRLSEGHIAIIIKSNHLKLFSKSSRSSLHRPDHTLSRQAWSAQVMNYQVRCLSLIFRPKTRGSDSSCQHTCSPAALYSGQWCFVSRSRSNASHQTIWTRASNWTSKASTIFPAGPCQSVFSVLNMQGRPGAFHGPLSFF